jgi:membrane protein CcdC involved in cytochrome C biogenesis
MGCLKAFGVIVVAVLVLSALWIFIVIADGTGGGLSGICLALIFAMVPFVVAGNVIGAFFAWLFGTSSKR